MCVVDCVEAVVVMAVVVKVRGDVTAGWRVDVAGKVPVWEMGVAEGVAVVMSELEVGAVVVRLGVVTEDVVGPFDET